MHVRVACKNSCNVVVQVHVSGRIRSQGSAEALQENLGNFVEDLSASASQLGNDMKLKMPKKKKVLSEEELVNKQVVALFKRCQPYRAYVCFV